MVVTAEQKSQTYMALYDALAAHDFKSMQGIFTSLFASIPHDWYRNNSMQQYEGFYCATVYTYLMGLGYQAIAEDVTSRRKIDMTLILDDSTLLWNLSCLLKPMLNPRFSRLKIDAMRTNTVLVRSLFI